MPIKGSALRELAPPDVSDNDFVLGVEASPLETVRFKVEAIAPAMPSIHRLATCTGAGTNADPYVGWQAVVEAMTIGQGCSFRPGKFYGFTGTLKISHDGAKIYGNGATLKCTSLTGASTVVCQLTGQTHTIAVEIGLRTSPGHEFTWLERNDVVFRDFRIVANSSRLLFISNVLLSYFEGIVLCGDTADTCVWGMVVRRCIDCAFKNMRSVPGHAERLLMGYTTPVNGMWFAETHPLAADDFVTCCSLINVSGWYHRGIGLLTGIQSFSIKSSTGFFQNCNRNFVISGQMHHFDGTDFEAGNSGSPEGLPPANTTDPLITSIGMPSLVKGQSSHASVTSVAAASPNQFTRATGSFVTDGYLVGEVITTAGFAASNNNSKWRVTAVATGALTVASSTVTTEAAEVGQSVSITANEASQDGFTCCNLIGSHVEFANSAKDCFLRYCWVNELDINCIGFNWDGTWPWNTWDEWGGGAKLQGGRNTYDTHASPGLNIWAHDASGLDCVIITAETHPHIKMPTGDAWNSARNFINDQAKLDNTKVCGVGSGYTSPSNLVFDDEDVYMGMLWAGTGRSFGIGCYGETTTIKGDTERVMQKMPNSPPVGSWVPLGGASFWVDPLAKIAKLYVHNADDTVDTYLIEQQISAISIGGIDVDKLATPGAPTVTKIGPHAGGATTHTFWVVAEDRQGRRTLAGTSGATTTGLVNTSLNNSNTLRISWTPVIGALKYHILKKATAPTKGGTETILLRTWIADSVKRITVTAGGLYPTITPTVTISGGGGSGATAVAIMNGTAVDRITITNPGTGYTSTPTVTLELEGGQPETSRALATASISDYEVYQITTDAASLASFTNANRNATGDSDVDGRMTAGNMNGTVIVESFRQTANVTTIAGTGEQNLHGTGIGTRTVPADMAQVGTGFEIEAWGVISSHSTPGNLTIRLKFGTVAAITLGPTAITASMASRGWHFKATIRVTATGTSGNVQATGLFQWADVANSATSKNVSWPAGGTAVSSAINFETTNDINFTSQYSVSNAANVMTCTHLTIRNTEVG